MSTPGSGAEPGGARPPAPADRAPDAVTEKPDQPPRRKSTGVFRWRGIIPLLLFVVLLAVAYILFAEPVARDTLAEASSKALGTQVDIADLRIDELETTLEIDGIQVADPFDPMRNMLEVGGIRVELEQDPLLEKKAVIRRLALTGVRTGTRRATAARPMAAGGFAPQVMRAVQAWRSQFDIPKLKLAELDTIRSLALDPRQLGTVKVAVQLRDRADSTRDAIEAEVRGLRLRETLDSTRALAERVSRIDPRALGIVGARQTVVDVRRTLDSLRAAKARLDALQRSARAGIAELRDGVGDLDSARRADYAFARGLLQLPTFEAPELGSAIFGDVSIDRFQQFVYYSRLAEGYVPPGLRPKATPGPERRRMSGTTVRFTKAREYPTFLVRRADVDFQLGGTAATSGDYVLQLANVTSQPALVGRPMEFALTRRGGSAATVALDVRGASDRRQPAPVDVVKADLVGVPLPTFALPGLPFTLDLDRGTSRLEFTRRGQAIAGSWVLNARSPRWIADSARMRGANYVERLVYRVIGGIESFDLEARVGGTFDAPQLSVRSTLDRAIAAELREALGEEIAKAERLVRSKVDSLVRDREAEARARVEALRLQGEARLAELQARLDEERARLDAERERLEARIKAATGGALGLPEIPRANLPSLPQVPGRRPAAPRDTAAKPDSSTAP